MPHKILHRVLAAPALVAVLLTTACTGTDGPLQVEQTAPAAAAPAPGTAPAAAGKSTGTPRPTPTATEQAPYPLGEVHTAPPAPDMGSSTVRTLKWDAQSEKQASVVATMAVFSLIQGGNNATRMREAKDYLSDELYRGWARGDLQKLPSHEVLDMGKLAPGWQENPYWVWVRVPTNDGIWRVRLHRSPLKTTWLAVDLEPPYTG